MAAHLKRLRQLMALRNLNVYILPRTDEHQYLCECDERVQFISGFSGSNGIALISQQQALLWTDGRYFLQAQNQLQQGWKLRKLLANQNKWFEHLASKYKKSKVGIDGRLISAESAQIRRKYLQQADIILELDNFNIVDQIWDNRPKSTASQIFLHEQFAGKTMKQKVDWVRGKIKCLKGECALFSDLSQIGWILNLRSSEIPYNPFFKSILVITLQSGTLYLPKNHPSIQSQAIIQHLKQQNINLKQYDPVIPPNALCTKSTLSYAIYSLVQNPIEWEGISVYRAVREPKQIEGFRRCHVSDGIAMAKFWSWRSKLDSVDELEAANYIDNLRMQQKFNKGLSFKTISGGGPNGAIIHYHPTQTNHSLVTKNMVHLLDSGGQYLDGTTDVTRAFNFGTPTKQQKDAYTRVLLGNLDIQRVKWPKTVNLTGADIDILARRHLLEKGMDYAHGTGHGVGYFQGVHESPCGISKYNKNVFKPGMIVTNQPGYYQPGKYGIRIENMLIVVQQNDIYSFDNFTLCPYDKNLLDMSLLSQKDKVFINQYHQKVWETLSPHLQDDNETLNWLKNATSPI